MKSRNEIEKSLKNILITYLLQKIWNKRMKKNSRKKVEKVLV